MSGPFSNLLRNFVEKPEENNSYQRKLFSYNITRFLNRAQIFQSTYPKTKWYIFAIWGLLSLKSYQEYSGKSSANEEINFRKQQLVQPIYNMNPEESVNVPWSEGNLKAWLYRPVRISGRPIHSKAKLVPRMKYGHHGYDYIVPLVTSEKPDGSHQSGVLINLGWMPHQWKQISSRYKIENASKQTFVAYVSLNSELEHSFGLKGNAAILARNKWHSVDLELMAHNSGFENADKAQLAVLEKVDLNTPLDEREMEHYSHDASYTQDYPFPKTRAGALQLKKMPWDHQQDAKLYLNGAILFNILGVASLMI